jgi:hypothetical protein
MTNVTFDPDSKPFVINRYPLLIGEILRRNAKRLEKALRRAGRSPGGVIISATTNVPIPGCDCWDCTEARK